MEIGGQAADQMARVSITLTEESIKLLASGSKNLTAFLLALAKDNRRLVGRTNMERLLREGKPLKVFHIKEEDMERFKQLAKQYGILYAGVKNIKSTDGMIDLISNVDYVSQINRVMEVMGYPASQKEAEETEKKDTTRAPQEKCSPERGSGLTPETTTPINDGGAEPEPEPMKGWMAGLAAANRDTDTEKKPRRENSAHNKVR